MSVGFDPGTDFESICDGLEAVTLNRRGSSSDVSVSAALRRNVSTTEITASNGRLMSGDTRWHLPAAEVATSPRMGDWIVDSSSNYWQILEVRQDTLSNRWRCVTRNLRIAFGLEDTATIEQASYAKGTAGAQERTWTPWRTGVRCRIQQVAQDHGDDFGARRSGKLFRILCEDNYAVTHEHRVKDSEGIYYQINGTSGHDDIGQPFVIEASQWRSS